MMGINRWLGAAIVTVACLAHSTAARGDDATSVTVTVGPNADKGVGYGTFEGAQILTLTIQPQAGYKIASTECTDNAGTNLWYQASASDTAHVWKTFGVLPNFAAIESHAARFHGTLTKTTAGTGAVSPKEFDVKVSDVDLDVDALARHVDAIWTPADPSTEPVLNDLEDKCEAGSDGGLAIPVTDAGASLPTTRPADSGKALRVAINAKKAGSLDFTGAGTKLAVYRQSGGQQNKVTEPISVTTSGLNEIFYLHTCTDFAAVSLVGEFTPTGSSVKGKDTVRIYPATDGYRLFVNTPGTTDDYVPVEACGRVPITVTRDPAAAAVDLKVKDNSASNAVKFYDAKIGGTGVTEKEFTMAAGISSKTFWVSGDADGTGARTIKLFEKNGENWDEKKSLAVTVYNLNMTVDGVTDADEETPGAYMRLNADNDNGSAWVAGTSNHIPTKYDFAVSPIASENDLTSVTVSLDAGGETLPGKIRIERRHPARSKLELWSTGTKTANLLNQDERAEYAQADVPEHFYVEGRVPGAGERESEIMLTYCPTGDASLPGDLVRVTVTPVLQQLTITAHAAGPRLVNDPGMGWILDTRPVGAGLPPAFTYEAKALVKNARGGLEFFQVAKCVNLLNGGAAGAVRGAQAWVNDYEAPYAGKWLLDAENVDTWFYRLGIADPVIVDDVWTHVARDTPCLPVNLVLPGAGQATSVDFRGDYITYAVWASQSQDDGRSVYVLASLEWSYRAHGTLAPAAGGTFTFTPRANNACTGNGAFTLTNVQPVRVTGPIANSDNATWR